MSSSSLSLNTPTHSECGEEEVEIKAGKYLSCPPISPESPISDVDLDTYDLSESLKIKQQKEKEGNKETMETNSFASPSDLIQRFEFGMQTMTDLRSFCPQKPQTETSDSVQNVDVSQEHQTNHVSQQQQDTQQQQQDIQQQQHDIQQQQAMEELHKELDELLKQPLQLQPTTPQQKKFWDDIDSVCRSFLAEDHAPIENNTNNSNSFEETMEFDEDEDGESYPLPLEEQSIPLVDTTPAVEEHSESPNTSDCTVPQQNLTLNIKKEKITEEEEEEEEEEVEEEVITSSVCTYEVVTAYLPSHSDTPGHMHFLKTEVGYEQIIRTESNQMSSIYERVLLPPATPLAIVKSEIAQNQVSKRKTPCAESSIAEKIPRIEGECFSSSSCVVVPSLDPYFKLPPPVKTMEDLGALNQRFKTDDPFKFNMTHKLFLLGRKISLNKTINLILINIMDEIEVGGLLNWDGRQNKTAFRGFKEIVQVIKDAVRKHTKHLNELDTDIEGAFKTWLKNAGTKRKNFYEQQQAQLLQLEN